MDINTLIQELDEFSPALLKGEGPAQIDSFRLMRADASLGDEYHLYIGTLEEFLQYTIPDYVATLLIVASHEEFSAVQDRFEGFRCIVVPRSVEILDLIDVLLNVFDQERRVTKGVQLYSRSIAAATQTSELQVILDQVYELLGNPFCICNAEGLVVDGRALDQLPLMPDAVFTTGQYVPDLKMFKERNREVDQAADPVLFESFGLEAKRLMIGKISIHGESAAYFFLMEHQRAILPSDFVLIKTVCQWLSLELQKDNISFAPQDSMIIRLMSQLLSASITKEEALECSRKINYGKKSWNNLLVADCSEVEHTASAMQDIRKLLELRMPGSKAVTFMSYMVFHINTDNYNYFTPQLCEFIISVAETYHLKFGLGYRYHDLIDTKLAFEQGQAAINLGANHWPDRKLFFYDDHALGHFLNQIGDEKILRQHCHPKLLELIQYDREEDTAYALTLFVLILANGRQAEAAKRLHVHRSTMLYRIGKIMEITGGVDLRDAQTVTRMYLSYSILIRTGELDPEEFSLLRWSGETKDEYGFGEED